MASELQSYRVTESQNYRVTDTQGYSEYEWVKFFVPDFNKLPYLLHSQGDNFAKLGMKNYKKQAKCHQEILNLKAGEYQWYNFKNTWLSIKRSRVQVLVGECLFSL